MTTEYIEPTQEHVGQMVEVRDTEDVGWTEATLTGIVHDDDFRFAAKRSGDGFSMCWRFARIPRPLTYVERQAKCGLKVGDRVKVLRRGDFGELGWENTWIDYEMDKAIGQVCTILAIDEKDGITLDQCDSYCFPYFVLEKYEETKEEKIENLVNEFVERLKELM